MEINGPDDIERLSKMFDVQNLQVGHEADDSSSSDVDD
jgi:hypothetical protein